MGFAGSHFMCQALLPYLCIYFFITLIYSIRIKKVAIVDTFTLALLFYLENRIRRSRL